MAAYYSENDPFAAAWLRELIADGLIADGEVDERSIADVSADDVRGFTQCHFFAGIGGWSYALRLAGWADDRFVWTGSAPCQPFSAAGAQAGGHDPRDLWPVWFQLIKKCRPATIISEQVEAAIGHGWLDRVCDDLEAEGYAVGACGLPAASVGAFHIRQRLWFVAQSEDQRHERAGSTRRRRDGLANVGATGDVADAEHPERRPLRLEDERDLGDAGRTEAHGESGTCGEVCDVADADRAGSNRQRREGLSADGHALQRHDADGCGESGGMADDTRDGRGKECADAGRRSQGDGAQGWPAGFEPSGNTGNVGHADQPGPQGRELSAQRARECAAGPTGVASTFWSDVVWLPCSDGKARPIQRVSQPLFQFVFDGLSRVMGPDWDSFVSHVENEVTSYAENSGCRADEILPTLWCAVISTSLRGDVGGYDAIQGEKILLLALCDLARRWCQRQVLQCSTQCVQAIQEATMRRVWECAPAWTTSRASHQWQLARPSDREPADVVYSLSSGESAQEAGQTLRGVPETGSTPLDVSAALSALEEIWRSTGDQTTGGRRIRDGLCTGLGIVQASGGFPLSGKIPRRAGLLRGAGNAICPQVAAEFIAAYMDC